jgi:hypothetical protein
MVAAGSLVVGEALAVVFDLSKRGFFFVSFFASVRVFP